MIGELTGTLIEMNAHMIITDEAMRAMIFGGVVAVLFGVLLLVMLTDRKKGNKAVRAGVCAFMMAIGIAILIAGNNSPRVKEIRYCAYGPIHIEEVAAKFDIVSIDGKEITVRER